ncbi:MAG TPA: hypothetical protein VKB80_12095, partial [Kofleriaceae bacterium]|nr:hypothetical protein [Kofleriaceae bacterium]
MGRTTGWTTRSWRAAAASLVTLGFGVLAAACGDDLEPPGGQPPPGQPDGAPELDAGGGGPSIEREQAGGAPVAVALAGDLAYLAVGPRLAIWRMPGAGGAAALVGESAPFRGVVTGLTVA